MKLKPKFFVKNISWIIPYIELKLLFVDFNNTRRQVSVMYTQNLGSNIVHNGNTGVIEINK